MTVSGIPHSVEAQEIEFASSPNPVGSGARALGMGGAGYTRSEDNNFAGHSEADGSQTASAG